jgi:hypothetical protein
MALAFDSSDPLAVTDSGEVRAVSLKIGSARVLEGTVHLVPGSAVGWCQLVQPLCRRRRPQVRRKLSTDQQHC